MAIKKPIPFEGTNFWCDDCNKTLKGQGYIIGMKAYCTVHYKKRFPKWEGEKQ